MADTDMRVMHKEMETRQLGNYAWKVNPDLAFELANFSEVEWLVRLIPATDAKVIGLLDNYNEIMGFNPAIVPVHRAIGEAVASFAAANGYSRLFVVMDCDYAHKRGTIMVGSGFTREQLTLTLDSIKKDIHRAARVTPSATVMALDEPLDLLTAAVSTVGENHRWMNLTFGRAHENNPRP